MSPYRSPALRADVASPRRGFLDTARRLGLMWRHSQRWNFAGGWPELLCGVAPGALLLLMSRGAGWAWPAGAALAMMVWDLGIHNAILGFLRAKRVRRLLGRDVPPMSVLDVAREVNARRMTPAEGARRIAEMGPRS